jgi:hypothetical protein
MNKILYLSCFFLLLISANPVVAQTTTSRVWVERGGRVSFQVNSLRRYEEGIRYMDWTTLAIVFTETEANGTPTAATWKLSVRAGSPKMEGSFKQGSFYRDLDLDYLEIMVVPDAASVSMLHDHMAVHEGEWIKIKNTDHLLVSGAPQGSYRLIVHYRLGQDDGGKILLGEPPDYYSVDLFFELSK